MEANKKSNQMTNIQFGFSEVQTLNSLAQTKYSKFEVSNSKNTHKESGQLSVFQKVFSWS